MSIFNYLSSERSGDYCEYNGNLSEYILCLDRNDKEYDFLKAILDKCPNIKVCINYHIPVVENSISNMIIKYKDISKLDRQTILCPYLFYIKDENNQSRAIICADDYFVAKGFYFTATEKDAVLNDYKNFIIACDKDLNNMNELLDILLTTKASVAQRQLDNKMFKDYDELYAKVLAYDEKIHENIFNELKVAKDKARLIQETITKFFLLKKTVYVQYMVNRELLESRHENDNRAQRSQAKRNADGVKFISMTQLWRGNE